MDKYAYTCKEANCEREPVCIRYFRATYKASLGYFINVERYNFAWHFLTRIFVFYGLIQEYFRSKLILVYANLLGQLLQLKYYTAMICIIHLIIS